MKFPIGFWNYPSIRTMTTEEVSLWADCGITLNMSPSYSDDPADHAALRGMLDECKNYGMQLILQDQRTLWTGAAADPAGYRARFQQAYDEFGHHPSVFGFFTGDEPSGSALEDSCAALKIQQQLAPELTGLLNFLPYWKGMEQTHLGGKSFEDWALDFISRSGSKLLCYDCYSQLNPEEEGTHTYFRNLNKFSTVARQSGIPIWTTLLSVGHFRYRVPTEDDLRWQVSTAAAAGCRGILWFTFYGKGYRNYRGEPINEYGEKTPTYYALRHVLRRFQDEHGQLLMDLRFKSAYHVYKAYGDYPLFAERETHPVLRRITSEHQVPAMVSFFTDPTGREYVVLVNNSPFESDLFKLWLDPGVRIYNLRQNGAERRDMALWHHDAYWYESPDEKRAGVWLAPGQMEIFCIES